MLPCNCDTTFLWWFYEEPALWADAAVLERFQSSIGARHAYIQSLSGSIGKSVKELHSSWVAGPQERAFRGARIKSIEFDEFALSSVGKTALAIEFETASGTRLVINYLDAVVSRDSLLLLSGEQEVVVLSHEFKVCAFDGASGIAHFFFLGGSSGRFIFKTVSRSVSIAEVSARSRKEPGSGLGAPGEAWAHRKSPHGSDD